MNTYNCPVCEQHYFDAPDNYDICPICGWENDGVQREKKDYWGGANSLSVNESKKVYELLKNKLLSSQVKKLLDEYIERDKEIYKKYYLLNQNREGIRDEFKKSHDLFITSLSNLF